MPDIPAPMISMSRCSFVSIGMSVQLPCAAAPVQYLSNSGAELTSHAFRVDQTSRANQARLGLYAREVAETGTIPRDDFPLVPSLQLRWHDRFLPVRRQPLRATVPGNYGPW